MIRKRVQRPAQNACHQSNCGLVDAQRMFCNDSQISYNEYYENSRAHHLLLHQFLKGNFEGCSNQTCFIFIPAVHVCKSFTDGIARVVENAFI